MKNQTPVAAPRTSSITTIGTTMAVVLAAPGLLLFALCISQNSPRKPSAHSHNSWLSSEPGSGSLQVAPFWHLHTSGAGFGRSCAASHSSSVFVLWELTEESGQTHLWPPGTSRQRWEQRLLRHGLSIDVLYRKLW